jgi:hypothetical protein
VNDFLKRLHLINFMSWRDQIFDFHPGINIICGVSKKGKSAIFNAIDLITKNEPLGDKYVSDWIKEETKKGNTTFIGNTICKMIFDDGKWVSRTKGKDGNFYNISTSKNPLLPSRSGPPLEVLDLLNMSELNMQEQGNPTFLLKDRPSDIGRRLNEITDLSEIDVAFKNINSMYLAEKANKRECKNIIKEQQSNLKDFDWLLEYEKKLVAVESIQTRLNQARTKEMQLRNYKIKVEQYTIEIKEQEKILQHKEKIESLLLLVKKYKKQQEIVNELKTFKENIDKCNKNIELTSLILSNKQKIDDLIAVSTRLKEQRQTVLYLRAQGKIVWQLISVINKANVVLSNKEKIESLLLLVEKYKKQQEIVNLMIDFENSFTEIEENYYISVKNLEKVQKEYDAIKPDRCPICDSVLF